MAFKVYLTDSTDAFTLPPGTGGTNAALAAAQPTASRAIDALILIGILFVLIKIPGWVARTIWQQAQPTLLKRLVKAVIIYKTFGAARSALGKARGGATGPTAKSTTAHHHGGPQRGGGPAGRGPRGRGPQPNGGPGPTQGGTQPVNPTTPTAQKASTGAARQRGPQQLELPLQLPPTTSTSAAPPAAMRRGRQLALPFPVARVPRPPASPAPAPPSGPWIRPRPPWIQNRLPGMPTRAPRTGQLRLRLDPPPRREPRKKGGS